MKPKSDKEIQAVLRLDGPARFRHFVRQVVDLEQAWGLWSDGWAMMATDDETPVFPLWPGREYAEFFCKENWADYEPKPISMTELLNDLLPEFGDRGVLPGVFPTPTGRGVTSKAIELAAALRTYDSENYG